MFHNSSSSSTWNIVYPFINWCTTLKRTKQPKIISYNFDFHFNYLWLKNFSKYPSKTNDWLLCYDDLFLVHKLAQTLMLNNEDDCTVYVWKMIFIAWRAYHLGKFNGKTAWPQLLCIDKSIVGYSVPLKWSNAIKIDILDIKKLIFDLVKWNERKYSEQISLEFVVFAEQEKC